MLYLVNTKTETRFSSKAIVPLAILVMFSITLILSSLGGMGIRLPDLVVALALGLVVYLYALFFRKGSALHKLFWTAIAVVFFALGSMASSIFSVMAFDVGDAYTKLPNWAMLQLSFISVLIQAASTYLVARSTQKSVKLSPLVLFLLIAIPVISCYVLTELARYGYGHNNGSDLDMTYLQTILSVGIGIINFAAFALYNYMSKISAENLVQQKELQKAELERVYHAEIETLYQETRTWRHDFRNHIQAIKGCFSQGNYERLGSYLDAIDHSTDRIELRVNSGNELLDAIVSAKITRAEAAGITFSTDLSISDADPIDAVDFTTLVGNLLDNAIEASEKTVPTEGRSFIDLAISDETGTQLMISVENSMVEAPVVEKGRYISSKATGDHGIGMSQIDGIVNKYEGFIMRKSTDGLFSTYVRIPLG